MNNVFSLRPKIGVGAFEVNKVINKKARRKITRNSPIFFKDIV
jgi:sialic acid synthase SpsE